MTIQGKLRQVLWSIILLIVVFSTFSIINFIDLSTLLDEKQDMENLLITITDFMMITDEYLDQPSLRVKEQWDYLYREIHRQAEVYPQIANVLVPLLSEQGKRMEFFQETRLKEFSEALTQQYIQRLPSQVRLGSRDMITKIQLQTEQISSQVRQKTRDLNRIIIIEMILIFLIITINILNVLKHTIGPLERLVEDAQKIINDDITQIIPYEKQKMGEIDTLVSSINTMSITTNAALMAKEEEILEREAVELALQESERYFRILFEKAVNAIYICSKEGKLTRVNDQLVKQTGYAKEELLNMAVSDLLNDGYTFSMESMTDEPESFQSSFISREGHTYPVEITSSSILINGTSCFIGTVRDITELELAEYDRERHQKQMTCSNEIATAFLEMKTLHSYSPLLKTLMNTIDGSLGIFSYTLEDDKSHTAIGTREGGTITISDFEQDLNEFQATWNISPNREETYLLTSPIELPFEHITCSRALCCPLIYNETYIGFIAISKGNGIFCDDELALLSYCARQTTPLLYERLENHKHRIEHDSLETQYHQSQKLESIGRLAGGVAHDLNNLLTPIIGYSEILENQFTEGSEKEYSRAILDAGTRAKSLVGQLLDFSRKQTLQFSSIDLNSLIKGFKPLLTSTLRENIELKLLEAEDLPMINGDKGKIEQIIMNLVVNAQDALLEGGTITIETDSIFLDEHYTNSHTGVLSGLYSVLMISDNGIGMDKEEISHIFEPFYTTKDRSKGTGLGLATVYGIVKQHGGNIWVYSEKDTGTTFKIYFPLALQPLESSPIEDDSQTTLVQGTEQVLLAEDNIYVSNLVVNLLTEQGYKVSSTSSGEEALALYKSSPQAFDLLLTDIIMGGIDGKELYRRLSLLDSSIKVLYMSGYSFDIISEHGVIDSDLNYIQKPFSTQKLLEKIRTILDEKENI